MTASKTLHTLAKPFRKAALGAGFALLSIWFVAASVATIHFEEQIAPVLSDAANSVAARSMDFTRGLSRLNALLAR